MLLQSSLVSIIMPAYNAQNYISDAIVSVLQQTHQNWELLIINDGSTDTTANEIEKHLDSRIYVYTQSQKGVSAARNKGLLYAKGQYICFLDADDVMPNRSIESRLALFESNSLLRFVDGSVCFYNENLTKVLKTYTPSFEGNPLKELVFLTGTCFVGQTWMIKKTTQIINFKEELSHGEDLLFYIQNAIIGGQYAYTKDNVLYYRQNPTSAMRHLKALERGYKTISKELSTMPEIPSNWTREFQKKSKKIMLKSYLKKYQIYHALKTFMSQ